MHIYAARLVYTDGDIEDKTFVPLCIFYWLKNPFWWVYYIHIHCVNITFFTQSGCTAYCLTVYKWLTPRKAVHTLLCSPREGLPFDSYLTVLFQFWSAAPIVHQIVSYLRFAARRNDTTSAFTPVTQSAVHRFYMFSHNASDFLKPFTSAQYTLLTERLPPKLKA